MSIVTSLKAVVNPPQAILSEIAWRPSQTHMQKKTMQASMCPNEFHTFLDEGNADGAGQVGQLFSSLKRRKRRSQAFTTLHFPYHNSGNSIGNRLGYENSTNSYESLL
jgi:hypothetical protein